MVEILCEAGHSPVRQVAKKYGVSEQTIYAWRKRSAGWNPSTCRISGSFCR